MLSKSGFLKGRQCARRLWLAVHRPPEPQVEAEDAWDLREAEGAEVEALAETLFPGIVRVAEPVEGGAPVADGTAAPRADFAARCARTARLLEERRPIAQAHFLAPPLLAVADVLEPRGDAWFLWEVKASTKARAMFDWDLAFQAEVLRRAGLRLAGAGLVLLDKGYVRAEQLDARALLARKDCTDVVASLADAVRAAVDEQLRELARADPPPAAPGSRCKGSPGAQAGDLPSDCGQLAHDGFCGRTLPAHWAGRLPRLVGASAERVRALPDQDVRALDPDGAAWSPDQARMIRAVREGRAQVDAAALRRELAALRWPVACVDFEFDPGMAVPRFPGSFAYARIPFQWSLAVQPAPGAALEHPEPFLHLDESDPRAGFVASLLAALPPAGSVVVYSAAAERTVLAQLARWRGGRDQAALEQVIARLFDAKRLVDAGYYHPDQQGSASIKRVAPAMLGRGYADLALQDGMAAVVAWKRACARDCSAEERASIRAELLRYCGRDVELLHALLEEARRLSGAA